MLLEDQRLRDVGLHSVLELVVVIGQDVVPRGAAEVGSQVVQQDGGVLRTCAAVVSEEDVVEVDCSSHHGLVVVVGDVLRECGSACGTDG